MVTQWLVQPNWLTTVGVIWDLSGAYALARGWLFVSDERLKRQSGSYYGASPAMSRANAEQRLDARLGFAHLLIGFCLQLLAALGLFLPPGIALWGLAPLALHWIVFASSYQDKVVADGVSASISPDAAESTWRKHYDDIPDLVWNRALVNAGIEFKLKVPPGS